MLNESGPLVAGMASITAVGLFDSEEKLVPLVSEFLTRAAQQRTLAFTSVATYGRNIGYMLEHLKLQKAFQSLSYDECLLIVSRNNIAQYFAHLREVEELDSTTVRNRDGCVMAFFNSFLCMGQGNQAAIRLDNPYAAGYISAAPKRRLVIACSLSDLKELILSTKYERERCVLQCIFDVGLRRSEVGRITLGAVNDALAYSQAQFVSSDDTTALNPDYCPLYVEGSKGRGNETKPRYSIVSRATLERVKRYHASPLYRKFMRRYQDASVTPCFFNAEGNPYNADSISKLLERVSERALKHKRISKMISPHKLRHGNAYAILGSPDLGTDYLDRLIITQKSLGHSRESVTEIYTQIPQDIYRHLCPVSGEIPTRAKNMTELAAVTKLKISLGDKM